MKIQPGDEEILEKLRAIFSDVAASHIPNRRAILDKIDEIGIAIKERSQ